MEKILEYLKKDIDDKSTVSNWNAKKYLNMSLAGSYDYYLVSTLDTQFLLVKPLETFTVQKISIHLDRMHEKINFDIAVLMDNITPYIRKKMIATKIPFLEIGKQMYLPFMAVHLQNNTNTKKASSMHKKFSPTTQLVFLAILYWQDETFEVFDIFKKLKLSEMSISRATTELESIGLINCEITGQTRRKKVFTRIDKKQYYNKGKKYLENAIVKTVFLSEMPSGISLYKSGLTALSEQTLLGYSKQEIYAIYSKKAKNLSDTLVSREKAMEEGLPMVQLIKYDIGLLANNSCVDPITLILGLDETDDRVEMAIDELMEGAEWYKE